MSTNLTSPFNNVIIDPTYTPIILENVVKPKIHSISMTFFDILGEYVIIVNTIGLYDHVGIRKDTETEFQYIRIENGVNTFRTTVINPNVDNIYFTMFDPLYNELDEYFGLPANLNTIAPILYEFNASPPIQIFKNGGNIITNETDF